ncbi:uncharacterized protein, partial [Labrus bergylta]|uniref:uncharacterized protein n=1 Tax=Labrus bergylta TaxID=56723 RepID=UPI0033138D2B
SFESLVLSFSHPVSRTFQPVVVVYRPPGPYSEFLSEFAEFLSDSVLNSDKIIVVGDFNIHVDVDNNSLSTAFMSLLDSIGFTQGVNEPTHRFNHTLDLVLAYGIEIHNLTVFLENPLLSDHFFITFDFVLPELPLPGVLSRSLSDSAVARFKEAISVVFDSVPCFNPVGNSYDSFSPSQLDQFVDSAVDSLRVTLDSIAPLKQKVVKRRRVAPWFNSETHTL